MKNIAYLFILLTEVRDDLVRGQNAVTVNCKYSDNGATAFCETSIVTKQSEVGLQFLDKDDKSRDITKLTLSSPRAYLISWIVESAFTFRRIRNLVDLTIEGNVIIRPKENIKRIAAELLNFVSMDRIRFASVIPVESTEYGVTFPQHLKHLILDSANLHFMDWDKPTKLDRLTLIGYYPWLYVPPYPTWQELNITEAGFLMKKFTVADIAFFCNMTKFSFHVRFLDAPCKCILLQTWEKYLNNESVPFAIAIMHKERTVVPFKEYVCKEPYDCLSGSDDPLKEAKAARTQCLHIKIPESKEPDPEETVHHDWVFWLYVVIAFLIASIIFMLLIFLAERLLSRSEESDNVVDAGDDLDDEELEEEI